MAKTSSEKQLSLIILSGRLEQDELLERLFLVISKQDLVRKLVQRMLKHFGQGSRPSVRAVKEWLDADKKFQKKAHKHLVFGLTLPATMAPPRDSACGWKVPHICTLGSLAHWLEMPVEHLDWFARKLGPVKGGTKLDHYFIKTIAKRSGEKRLLEIPKYNLKQYQRHILHGILDYIPPHPASHGFQKDRSIVSFVRPHVAKKLVIKFDLADYFLSVDKPRVRSLFHRAGYPPQVAEYLSSFCTHSLNHRIPTQQCISHSELLTVPHLPQGAPTSPAIADRLLYKLDCRFTGLAKKMNMHYTRYADDIAFSSDTEMGNKSRNWFTQMVRTIIQAEGWSLNEAKTRYMHSSQCQRLAGIIINTQINVARKDYDELKATIHGISRNGLDAENRDNHPHFLEHLMGRINFVKQLNASKGEKLEQRLKQCNLEL